jgi:hypothetical protein
MITSSVIHVLALGRAASSSRGHPCVGEERGAGVYVSTQDSAGCSQQKNGNCLFPSLANNSRKLPRARIVPSQSSLHPARRTARNVTRVTPVPTLRAISPGRLQHNAQRGWARSGTSVFVICEPLL